MVDPRWLVVLQAAEAGSLAWARALKSVDGPGPFLALGPRRLARFRIGREAVAKLETPDERRMARWREWLAEPGHALVPFGSRSYPERLAEIPDPPLALWAAGPSVDLLRQPQLAIVGSRHPTAGGVQIAKQFAASLSERGVAITSGLAKGIDRAGHEGALLGVGGTVAVLGSGIDRIYPRSNWKLADEIGRVGLIVSEYAPGVQARAFHFPRRNRIIAGLALGTLIVEATRQSGSLITANAANDFGREVFAVPGSINNPLTRGCHHLLGQGAKLVETVDDILMELAPIVELQRVERGEPEPPARAEHHDPERRKFLNLLGFEPVSVSQLVARAGLTAAEVSSMLLLLEMEGMVEALPGGRYCRLVKRA